MTGWRVSDVGNLMAVVAVSLLEEAPTPSQTSQYNVCVMEEVGIEDRKECVEEVDIEGGVGCVEVGNEGCEEEMGIENTEGGVYSVGRVGTKGGVEDVDEVGTKGDVGGAEEVGIEGCKGGVGY